MASPHVYFVSSRRRFLRNSALMIVGSPILLSMLEGCPVSQTQISDLLNEVGYGLEKILPYFSSVSAAAAAKVEAAFQTFATDVRNFQPGQAISLIEQAANDFVGAMSLIPVLAAYQPLVALIVATVEGIIAVLNPAPAGGNVVTMNTHGAPVAVTRTAKGHVVVSYQGLSITDPPKSAAAFKKAWNKAGASIPGYAL